MHVVVKAGRPMKRIIPVAMLSMLLLACGCATAVMSGAATGDREYDNVAEDSRITREVRMEIYRDRVLADDRIYVSTSQGIVTLRGSVDDPADIGQAVSLANRVKGVRGVNVELHVGRRP